MVLSILALLGALSGPVPQDGEALIREMHARYAGKWYRTLTFVQKTTHEDGKIETWFEALQFPGLLRIDIAPIDSGNVLLFRHDSLYVIRGGQSRPARFLVHPLMVLGFDIYFDSPETTIGKLKGLGFDLTKMREDTWQGRPVYVVGAAAGDTVSNQFWIDKERLVFVRSLQPGPGGAVMETQFNKYQRLGEGWVSPEVLFYRNGVVDTREEYADMRADVPLPATLFDSKYAEPEWVTMPVRQ